MSVKRVYQKAQRTPEELSELRAVREKYQREKPSAEDALAASGQMEMIPLGELIQLHQLLAQLKGERERQQVTLAEMEQRTGISQAALSRLENGKADNPTLHTIYRISSALGKVVTCVLEDAPPARRRMAKA
jgi:DNA-binding Xre family transcriptional regulator